MVRDKIKEITNVFSDLIIDNESIKAKQELIRLISNFQFFYGGSETIEYVHISLEDFNIFKDDIVFSGIIDSFILARLYDYDRFLNKSYDSSKIAFRYYLDSFDNESDFYLKSMCLFSAFYLHEKYNKQFDEKILVMKLQNLVDNMSYDTPACNISILKLMINYMDDLSFKSKFDIVFYNILEISKNNGFVLDKLFNIKRDYYNKLKFELDDIYIEEMNFMETLCIETNGYNHEYALRAFNIAKLIKDKKSEKKFKSLYEKLMNKFAANIEKISIPYDEELKVLDEKLYKIASGMSIKEMFLFLSHNFISNFEKEKKQMINEMKLSILSSYSNFNIINSNGLIISKRNKLTNDDICNDTKELKENLYLRKLDIFSTELSVAYPFLDTISKCDVDDLSNQINKLIDSCYIISDNRKEIVKKGIKAGFKNDLEIAISILIPQIEDAIRNLAKLCEVSEIEFLEDGKIKRYNTIEHMIKNEDFIDLIDSNIIYTINAVLNNHNGINYRNMHAHGLIDYYNTHLSLYVFLVIFSIIMTYSHYTDDLDLSHYIELFKEDVNK
ncbi:MAG: DUF4209 domain-containing protein [bacterium]